MSVSVIGTALLLGATALPPASGAEATKSTFVPEHDGEKPAAASSKAKNPFGTVPKLRTLFGAAYSRAGASAETESATAKSTDLTCDCQTAESTSSSTTSTVSTAAELTSALGADAELIVLKPGIYKLDDVLVIKRGVSLWAEPGSVTLDGQDKTRVLKIDAGTALVELHGISIRNGRGVIGYHGGGVRINNGNVNFNNCQIYDNEASEAYGGGVYVSNGQVTFTDSNIYGNTAIYYGGGVYADGTVNFQDCNIYGNTATRANGGGGGVFVSSSGRVKVKDLQMWENSPDDVTGKVTSVQVYSPSSA